MSIRIVLGTRDVGVKERGFSGPELEILVTGAVFHAEKNEDRCSSQNFEKVPKNGTFWPKFWFKRI